MVNTGKFSDFLILALILSITPVCLATEESKSSALSAWKYRYGVMLVETAGVDRVSEPIEVILFFKPGECVNATREVRVADIDGREVPSQVYNVTYEEGWSTSANVVFQADVPANSSSIYYIYYGNPDAEYPSYVTDLEAGVMDSHTYYVRNQHIYWEFYNKVSLRITHLAIDGFDWTGVGEGWRVSHQYAEADTDYDTHTPLNFTNEGWVVKGPVMAVWKGFTKDGSYPFTMYLTFYAGLGLVLRRVMFEAPPRYGAMICRQGGYYVASLPSGYYEVYDSSQAKPKASNVTEDVWYDWREPFAGNLVYAIVSEDQLMRQAMALMMDWRAASWTRRTGWAGRDHFVGIKSSITLYFYYYSHEGNPIPKAQAMSMILAYPLVTIILKEGLSDVAMRQLTIVSGKVLEADKIGFKDTRAKLLF